MSAFNRNPQDFFKIKKTNKFQTLIQKLISNPTKGNGSKFSQTNEILLEQNNNKKPFLSRLFSNSKTESQ